jgi:hypothetical protein
VASSDERVWAIDSDQYAAGDGPCLEAARSGQLVRVSREQAQKRWPEFARSARAAGVASYQPISAPRSRTSHKDRLKCKSDSKQEVATPADSTLITNRHRCTSASAKRAWTDGVRGEALLSLI